MLLDKYWKEIDTLYNKVKSTQHKNIIRAGNLIAEAVDLVCIFMILGISLTRN